MAALKSRPLRKIQLQLEFGVQMTSKSCEQDVQKSLSGVKGINSVSVDLVGETVVVETSLPWFEVKDLLEKNGKRAVVLGLGSGKGQSLKGLGAAVSMMEGRDGIKGVTRMVQVDTKTCVLEGTVDGLLPGMYNLSVHEFGDLTRGCDSCGGVFRAPFSKKKNAEGEVGSVQAGENGRSSFKLDSSILKVNDIIGRSMVLHSAKERVACGIIARSSGLFQNSKRICACDGVSLWDERDVPLAGAKRSKIATDETTVPKL